MAEKRSFAIDPGHDELELFQTMLRDKFVNLELDTIVKDVRIIRLRHPENVGKFPGVRLYMGGWREAEWGIPLDREGSIGDKITKFIIAEIYMLENEQFVYYGNTYKGAEKGIMVIRDVIYRIISENQRYDNDEMPDINFDWIMPANELWFQQYLNNPNASALQLTLEVRYQKKHIPSSEE